MFDIASDKVALVSLFEFADYVLGEMKKRKKERKEYSTQKTRHEAPTW